MKLIIDIDEKQYEYCKHKIIGIELNYDLNEAIANGTPYNPTGDLTSRRVLKNLISDKSIPIKFEKEKRGDWHRSLGMTLGDINQVIDNAPTVEITEEQAINKLHETGWLIEHDKEMTTRPKDELLDYIKLSLKQSDELKEKYRNKHKESNSQHDLYYSHLFEGMAEAYDDLLKKMGESDTQGKQERPKGEWIELCRGIHVTDYKCSCCGRTVRDDTGYDVSKDYPFCHCGADMRKGGEQENDNEV